MMRKFNQWLKCGLLAVVMAGLSGAVINPLSAAEPAGGTETAHHHPEGIRQHDHHATVSGLPLGVALTAAWDSRYVLEGRDMLDGDSLLGTNLELGYAGFTLGAWYGNSPENEYDEFNASIEYRLELGDFECYASYTHLQFLSDDLHDNEVGAGVACNGLPWGIVPAADWYYSFDAAGSFLELSAAREFTVTRWLKLEPGMVFGINQGYVVGGHDGANHFAAVLSATVELVEHVEIGGYLSYSWALDSDAVAHPGDALLKDLFFGGISLTFSF